MSTCLENLGTWYYLSILLSWKCIMELEDCCLRAITALWKCLCSASSKAIQIAILQNHRDKKKCCLYEYKVPNLFYIKHTYTTIGSVSHILSPSSATRHFLFIFDTVIFKELSNRSLLPSPGVRQGHNSWPAWADCQHATSRTVRYRQLVHEHTWIHTFSNNRERL